MMMSTASRQGQGIFGTHYGLPLTGSRPLVTKSHKEENHSSDGKDEFDEDTPVF